MKTLKTKTWWPVVLAFLLVGLLIPVLAEVQQVLAQGATPTSLSFSIPSRTATVISQLTMTPSRTPTAEGPNTGRVEAKDKTTGANVRASPDVSAEKLGTIYPGQFYAIVARSNKWLEIQYDKAASGRGWVYEDIVNITGIKPDAIPIIDAAGVPSPNVATGAAQATAAFLTQTPGAPGSATALKGSATGVTTRGPDDASPTPGKGEILPTFTFPPPMAEATLPGHAGSPISQGGMPPVVPILVLGGVGLLGLLISGLRRGG